MKYDYKFYKEHGLYDFLQKQKGRMKNFDDVYHWDFYYTKEGKSIDIGSYNQLIERCYYFKKLIGEEYKELENIEGLEISK